MVGRMELLDVLAYKMGCTYLSDLRYLPCNNNRLHRLVEAIDLSNYPEQEWIAAAEYLCNSKFESAYEAKESICNK